MYSPAKPTVSAALPSFTERTAPDMVDQRHRNPRNKGSIMDDSDRMFSNAKGFEINGLNIKALNMQGNIKALNIQT